MFLRKFTSNNTCQFIDIGVGNNVEQERLKIIITEFSKKQDTSGNNSIRI